MYRFSDDSFIGLGIRYDETQAPLFAGIVEVSAELTGSSLGSHPESDVVDGGLVSIVTITGDTIPAAGAPFDAQRAGYIAGFSAGSTTTNGWNNEVRDKTPVTACTRIDDNSFQIIWPAQPGFDISAPEVITGIIHADGIEGSDSPVVINPSFAVISDSSLTHAFRTTMRNTLRTVQRSTLRNPN